MVMGISYLGCFLRSSSQRACASSASRLSSSWTSTRAATFFSTRHMLACMLRRRRHSCVSTVPMLARALAKTTSPLVPSCRAPVAMPFAPVAAPVRGLSDNCRAARAEWLSLSGCAARDWWPYPLVPQPEPAQAQRRGKSGFLTWWVHLCQVKLKLRWATFFQLHLTLFLWEEEKRAFFMKLFLKRCLTKKTARDVVFEAMPTRVVLASFTRLSCWLSCSLCRYGNHHSKLYYI